MNLPFIIVIRAGVLDTAEVSTRENCERRFLEKCASCITNWDEYDADDVQCILDDGYAEFGGNGSSVCLTWIDEIPSENPEPTVLCQKCSTAEVVKQLTAPTIFVDGNGLHSLV